MIGIGLFPSPAGDVAEAVRRIAKQEGIQTALKDPDPEPSRSEPGRRREGPRRERRGGDGWGSGPGRWDRRSDGGSSSSSAGGGELAKGLLWLLLGALGVGLVALLLAALRRAPASTAGAVPAAADARKPQGLPQAPLAAASALAADGDYATAVHRLLLEALAVLAQACGETIADSETSREVLARLTLTPAARQALALLVEAVEVSRFGGRPIGRATWEQACAAWAAGRPGGGAA